MDIKKVFVQDGIQHLFAQESDKLSIQFGFVTINPGERVPEKGVSCHSENEYSFIIQGTLEGESGGKPYRVTTSDATLIPAEEEHWAINTGDEPCHIIWALVKEK